MSLMRRYVTKDNLAEGAVLPYFAKDCRCFTQDGILFKEDPQQVLRCFICGSPSVYPEGYAPEVKPFKLELILYVFRIEPSGERIWEYKPA